MASSEDSTQHALGGLRSGNGSTQHEHGHGPVASNRGASSDQGSVRRAGITAAATAAVGGEAGAATTPTGRLGFETSTISADEMGRSGFFARHSLPLSPPPPPPRPPPPPPTRPSPSPGSYGIRYPAQMSPLAAQEIRMLKPQESFDLVSNGGTERSRARTASGDATASSVVAGRHWTASSNGSVPSRSDEATPRERFFARSCTSFEELEV